MGLEKFWQIESKYNLTDLQIDGFSYWTFYREYIGNCLERQIDNLNESHIISWQNWQHCFARMGMIKNSILHSRISIKECDVLFLNHERRKWIDGNYECIYTDLIASEYKNSIVLERPYMQKHFRPVCTQNLIYTDYIEIKAMIYMYCSKIVKKNKVHRLKNVIKNSIIKAILEVNEYYGVTLPLDDIINQMVTGYFIYVIKKRSFDKLIKKICPQVIVEVVGYNMDCMIVNEIASTNSIPTIELQHGSTGKIHAAYNIFNNKLLKQYAKYFFVFSEYWKKAAAYPFAEEKIKCIGYPFLEKRAKIIREKCIKEEKKNILFISQGTIANYLIDIAIGLSQIIDKSKYIIIYKLHPGEYMNWQQRYPQLAASEIHVIDSNREDLYELFAKSTYQIGAGDSTAIYEGLFFELKTFIWNQKISNEFYELCTQGYAQLFENANELYTLIQDENVCSKPNNFWQQNSLANMKYEIDRIMRMENVDFYIM